MAYPIRSGNEYFAVAIGTDKRHFQVNAVAEYGTTGKGNFSDLMALHAIALHGKSTFTVMAGTTGNTILHLRHGNMRIRLVRLKQATVAIRAGEHAEMLAVFEDQRAEFRDGNRYGINRVAGCAGIQLRCSWIILVMARSARLPLFHFRHGNCRVVLPGNMINCIMAGRAVVVEVFEVIFMTERNFSGALGRYK